MQGVGAVDGCMVASGLVAAEVMQAQSVSRCAPAVHDLETVRRRLHQNFADAGQRTDGVAVGHEQVFGLGNILHVQAVQHLDKLCFVHLSAPLFHQRRAVRSALKPAVVYRRHSWSHQSWHPVPRISRHVLLAVLFVRLLARLSKNIKLNAFSGSEKACAVFVCSALVGIARQCI